MPFAQTNAERSVYSGAKRNRAPRARLLFALAALALGAIALLPGSASATSYEGSTSQKDEQGKPRSIRINIIGAKVKYIQFSWHDTQCTDGKQRAFTYTLSNGNFPVTDNKFDAKKTVNVGNARRVLRVRGTLTSSNGIVSGPLSAKYTRYVDTKKKPKSRRRPGARRPGARARQAKTVLYHCTKKATYQADVPG